MVGCNNHPTANPANQKLTTPPIFFQDVTFEQLSEQELRDHWSKDNGDSLRTKATKLAKMEVATMIEVRLVGMRADGNLDLNVGEAELLKYLEASSSRGSKTAHILHPKDGKSHDLPFTTHFFYRVSHANQKLASDITQAIQKYIDANQDVRESKDIRIPYDVVDDVIARDHEDNKIGYAFYILNPFLPSKGVDTFSYKISQLSSATWDDSRNFSSPTNLLSARSVDADCGVSSWAGQRGYGWIDLSSGPTAYGPKTNGEGIVLPGTVPRPDDVFAEFLSQKKIKTMNVNLNSKQRQFVAQLAAQTVGFAHSMVGPSIHKFPVNFMKEIVIQIVIIHDKLHDFANHDHHHDGEEPKEGNGDDPKVAKDKGQEDMWDAVQTALSSLALPGQRVRVYTYHVRFEECELCVSAFTHALKVHSSPVADPAQGGLRMQMHSYLDSAELKDWLEHFDHMFWGMNMPSVMPMGVQGSGESRILTAFVFDLSSEQMLLLDRFHQAVAFDDMVIAIQTKAPEAMVDQTCNGKPARFLPSDSSRAVAAALLQAGWGVSATHEAWNPVLAASETNYQWAVGHTPFAHFSSLKTLSFAIRDAAFRNIIYSDLNDTMTGLHHLLRHFASFELEIQDALDPDEHLIFLRRLNVLSYKLEQSNHFLAVANFQQSILYSRSAISDLKSLHVLVDAASHHVAPKAVCGPAKAAGLQAWLNYLLRSVQAVALLLLVGLYGLLLNTWGLEKPVKMLSRYLCCGSKPKLF